MNAVFTKWGWVNGKALYRLKEAWLGAVDQGRTSFKLDGQDWLVTFAGYLIEYVEGEGVKPIPTSEAEPIFQPEQGHA
jgi:hypothetical protein